MPVSEHMDLRIGGPVAISTLSETGGCQRCRVDIDLAAEDLSLDQMRVFGLWSETEMHRWPHISCHHGREGGLFQDLLIYNCSLAQDQQSTLALMGV